MDNRRKYLPTDHTNDNSVPHPQDLEMYPARGYHEYGPQHDNVSVLPGQNWTPHHDADTMTHGQSHVPPAGLMSHQQERAMYPMHEVHGNMPQVENTNVFKGQNYPPQYGMVPMTHSQPNIPSVISHQPGANAGPTNPSEQWSTQATVRGSNTHNEANILQSNQWIIIKRIISIVCMVIDISLAWSQLSEMEYAGIYTEFSQNSVGMSCPKSYPIIVTYIIFMSVCTLYTIGQIINVIGETVYDVTQGKHGFQIVHGLNEVMIKVAVKDIPQLLLMAIAVFFKCECTSQVGRWFKFIFIYLAPVTSSIVRTITCKKDDTPFCRCYDPNAQWCVPKPERGCECPHLCCYLPTSSQKYKPCVPISIYNYLGSCKNGGCKLDCAPRPNNPDNAEKTLDALYSYQLFFLLVNIALMIYRCDIPWLQIQQSEHWCGHISQC